MVNGKLEFDPRQTRDKFQKNLPQGDVLARASALEKSVKGARFVVTPEIARELVMPKSNWLTLRGYIDDPIQGHDMRLERSVSPMSSIGMFEILYPVYHKNEADNDLLQRDMDRMRYFGSVSSSDVTVQYTFQLPTTF